MGKEGFSWDFWGIPGAAGQARSSQCVLHFVPDPIPVPAGMRSWDDAVLGWFSPGLAALGKVEFQAGGVGGVMVAPNSLGEFLGKQGWDGAGATLGTLLLSHPLG